MHPELSDLLAEAKADAPPARYDVDDVVAAGRRLRRRRTTGWAIVAAAAVAVAIGVPQIVARGPERQIEPAPAITLTTPVPGKPVSFNYVFQGYDAGAYRVADPDIVSVDASSARIRRIGASPEAADGGLLRIYPPGVDPLADSPGATVTETDPVKGRRAFLAQTNGRPSVPESGALGWEYADGAVAVVWPDRDGMSPSEMRQVAEGFTLHAARAVKLPFKAAYVPSGYRLVEVGGSFARFEIAARAVQKVTEPNHVATAAEEAEPYWNLLFTLTPAKAGTSASSTKVTCDIEGCYRPVDDGRFQLRAGGSVPAAEVHRMLDSVTVARPDDPSTWFGVNDAFPASVQLKNP